ncbi:transporter substrate-binding domain-containing protein [Paralcaligenes ureilyticus]|uniref:Amino acid ABC transporter substrate-binding protein (PAAT family) n=1 Tax=Paralcaligenes ureilyticus TaxID=627131 RepID=A0A4R3M5M3_9BURK|nr:transporter substrate-binding domain-containing protein [Paralcaligenes ureilyticus]TCT08671.1 amino acid ABC transporter substrate-binding protein (PAAT family) [Paralcaligenes ureilyticus]
MNSRLLHTSIGGALLLAGFISTNVYAQDSKTDTVIKRGELICGTDNTKPGFGYLNPKTGKLEGFDVDYCHAMAAGILGDGNKVKMIALTDKNRFNALQNGEVDVVFFHTTVTATRATAVGADFLPVNFYDGTGVLVKKADKIAHIADLNGGTICTTQGSTTEAVWADYIKSHKWEKTTQVLTYQDLDKLFAALNGGRCNAMTTDKSALVGWKGNAPKPDDFDILPETISKEPLAGFVRQDDQKWHTALAWIVYALVEAEELGITSKNVAEMAKDPNPDIQRFLGTEGDLGKDFGLAPDFIQKVIAATGNYGEIYDRNVGPSTPYSIARKGSLNDLWTRGGLMYSPPFR